jgi:hypothetical protein
MKYFIVGLHSTGKQEVVDHLEKMGVKCGKIFSNIEEPSENIYNSSNYELYSNEDINDIFENDAYVFIQELPQTSLSFKTGKYYEGLSKYSLDQNEVFILSPDQLLAISPNTLNKEDICFVWLDSTKTRRSARYHNERRMYNYQDREQHERKDLSTFVKTLYAYDAPMIYFIDEEPLRVATIIYTTITHPDTFDMFVKNYN